MSLVFTDFLQIANCSALGYQGASNLNDFYTSTGTRLTFLESITTGGLGVFPVTNYGADNTGVSDCTNAIQSAITAAYAYSSGNHVQAVVQFPAGKYKITNKIGIRQLDINNLSKLSFVGVSGKRSVLSFEGNAGAGDWYLWNVRGGSTEIEFINLVMDMANLTNPDPADQNHLLQLGTSCNDIKVIDCEFKNTVGDGVRLAGDFGVQVQNILISRCRFVNCSRSSISFQRWVRGVTVEHCQMFGGGDQQVDFEPTGFSLTADAGGSSTVLIDASSKFVDWGVQAGDPIFNTTYNVLCYIISVDSQTQLTISAGATTWDTALYYFPLHNSHHIFNGNQHYRTTSPDIIFTISGSYAVQVVNCQFDGCIQAQDAFFCTLSNCTINTLNSNVNTPAIQFIKTAAGSKIINNTVICKNTTYATGRSAITVTDQAGRNTETVDIEGNTISLETNGIGINVEGVRYPKIRNNSIILNTPGQTNQSGAINVRATNQDIVSMVVTGNEIHAFQGTFLYGLQLSASSHNINSCIVGGGTINHCSNPVTFPESTGTFTTVPVLQPILVLSGSSPIVPPTSQGWVQIAGSGGLTGTSFTPAIFWGGTATPEGALTAGIGSMAIRRDNGGLYTKTANTTNVGWKVATVT